MSENPTNDRIQQEVDSSDVVLFMKGSPIFPQCGFSSAVVQAIVDNTINWEKDHDFGYELATEIPGFTNGDHYLLQPRRYYSDTDRRGYYEEIVHQLKQERHLHLQNFPGLAPEIIRALS